MTRFAWAARIALAASSFACGGDNFAASSPDSGPWWTPDAGGGCFSSNDCPTGWTCSEFYQCEPPPPMTPDGGAPLPPEVEREFSPPSSALRYVYVTMTDLDALAKIDGATLAVASVPVGDRPELVAAIPGSDDAVVLDKGSSTATVVYPTVDYDERITLRTLPHLNVLTMAGAGRRAVAWFDLVKAVVDAGGLDGALEVGSFQDVTILDMTRGEERAVDLSVGFRPREVEFDDAGTHAYVITEDGVSVIDLDEATSGGAHVAAPIPVTADPFSDPDMVEVEITADGAYAIVRETGRAELRLVDMLGDDAGAAWTVPLPAEATDVDLSPDGARAFAMLREAHVLAVIDVPGDGVDPAGLELVDIGSELAGSCVLDETASRALLFTNAADVERVVVVDLAAPGYPTAVRQLEKGVRAAAFGPGGETALILHNKHFGDPSSATSVDEYVDRSYGYSLLHIPSGFAKVALTPVDPGAFTFAPGEPRAYLALDGGDAEGAVARVQVIDLDTFVVEDLELGSPPEALGVLPGAGQVFVSQRHPLGRVTFVDLDTRATRTVTGFELNSHIVD